MSQISQIPTFKRRNFKFYIIFYFCLYAASFFHDCISEQDLDEMNIEIIRNSLYKVYTVIIFTLQKIEI